MADHTRASDTERERVALQLASAASDGRLTVEELEERTGAALAASTRGELAALLDDLPDARLPAQRRRRLPWLPGRMSFSARWRGPKNPQRAGNDMLELLVPVFARDGYLLVDRTGDRLVLERESRPGWTILVAIAVFPIGLIALAHKSRDRVTIDMIVRDDHTVAVAQGVAPLAIRRGLADLENV